MKLQFRSETAAVAHRKELVTRHSRRQDFVCFYAVMRAQLREQLVCEVGEEKVRSWEELGDEQQYQALLSDYFVECCGCE